MATLARLNVTLALQAQAFERGVRQAQAATQQMERGLRGLGGAMSSVTQSAAAFASAMAATRIVSSVINAATDAVIGFNAKLEQSKIGWETILGSTEAADAMIRELQQFAATTPFEFLGLQESARQLVAMGFSARDVLPLLEDIGNVTAGLGVGQEGIDRITRALGQMQAKTRVQTEELLQLQELGIPALQLLADAMGVPVAEAQKMVSQGKVASSTFIAAFREFARNNFGGLMERQAQTFSGAISTIRDSVQIALSTAFRPLFGAVSQLAQQFAAFVSSERFLQTANDIAAVVGNLINMFRGLDPSIQPAIVAFAGITAAVAALAPILGIVATALGTILSPIGLVIAAVGVLAAAWMNNWFGIRDTVLSVLPAILDTAVTVAATIAAVWQAVVPTIGKIVEGVLAFVQDLWVSYGDDIMAIVSDVGGFLFDTVSRSMEQVMNVINIALSLIKGDWEDAWNAFRRFLFTIWEQMISAVSTGARAIVGIVRVMAGTTFKLQTAVLKAFGREDLAKQLIDPETVFAGWEAEITKFENAAKDMGASVLGVERRTRSLDGVVGSLSESVDLNRKKILEAWRAFKDKLFKGVGDVATQTKSLDEILQGVTRNTTQVNGALEKAGKGTDALRKHVQELNEQLREAEQRLEFFRRPLLRGMGALDEQIFQVEQELARREFARLVRRFPELGPVPQPLTEEGRQIAARVPRGRSRAEQFLRGLQLRRQLEFEEQLRILDRAAQGPQRELTLEEALQGIFATKLEIVGLKDQLEAAERALEAQEKANKAQEVAANNLSAAATDQSRSADALTKAANAMFERLDKIPVIGGMVKPRAHGGPFGADDTLLVGEHGPELARFGSSGSIVPHETLAALASGGGTVVTVTIQPNGIVVQGADDGAGHALGQRIVDAIVEAASSAGAPARPSLPGAVGV